MEINTVTLEKLHEILTSYVNQEQQAVTLNDIMMARGAKLAIMGLIQWVNPQAQIINMPLGQGAAAEGG